LESEKTVECEITKMKGEIMFCPKCGTENPDGANLCRNCGMVLTSVSAAVTAPVAKTSALAITSMILGILSFCTFLLTAPLALILGIIALVKIAKSNGRLKGTGMAIIGIVVPVVALPIVAIMMGIMLPGLAQARSAAQRVVCINNLKQLGVATMLYAKDNNDRYPSSDKWCDLLKPYYKDDKLLICPSASHAKCSYAMNKNLPEFTKQVKNPAETILLFESKPGWNQSGSRELLTTENHHESGSILFCDGHVEFRNMQYINNLNWTAGP
jgi:prepilin-type processing-associated H-X9-DG protein